MDGSSWSPSLRRGITSAAFQSEGKVHGCMEGTIDDLCDGNEHYLQGVSKHLSFDFVWAGGLIQW